MHKTVLFMLMMLGMQVQSSMPDVLRIADFETGNQNLLDGYFNRYQRSESKAKVSLVDSVSCGGGGKSLKVEALKSESGFCGAWLQFFDYRAETRKYLDASDFKYLTFWVKGATGGEQFHVQIADKRYVEIEDSLSIGPIGRFLPGGVTTEWQRVVVPISALERLDVKQLGGLILNFKQSGRYTVYVDNVAMKRSLEPLKIFRNSCLNAGAGFIRPKKTAAVAPSRTMWAWNVIDILNNEKKEQSDLFAVCEKENFGRIWLQLPVKDRPSINIDRNPDHKQAKNFSAEFELEPKLRKFIREAHARGLKVEALDGYPEYALKKYHFIPLALVDAVIDYNRRVDPAEKFDGIHFDNEPYLIVGWMHREVREQILREFLELNIESQRRVHEQSDLVFGVDLPFWWNMPDPQTRGSIGDVTFDSVRKSAAFFAIDRLDNIGIMDYRDSAWGADGIIAFAEPLLDYAAKEKRNNVVVGLELFREQPRKVWFALGTDRVSFWAALRNSASGLSMLSRINGFRLRVLDDGKNLHVGIELPNEDRETTSRAAQTLVEVVKMFGVSSEPGKVELKNRERASRWKIRKEPGWMDYRLENIVDPNTGRTYPGFVATTSMLGKTTFADETYSEFKEQLHLAEDELTRHPAYRGTALHYFDVINKKVKSARGGRRPIR